MDRHPKILDHLSVAKISNLMPAHLPAPPA
jgi:hypothetical protein